MKQGVSIVVCCYNSASKLPETLRHLSIQSLDAEVDWEVIVVDNASTDNTSIKALEIWQGFQTKVPMHIVHQPELGLSFARSKGILSANFEYIILCDDDNWLHDNFIQNALKLMNGNSAIGILGAKGRPVFEQDPPAWFQRTSMFGVGAQGSEFGPASTGYVYGAGAVIRKSAYQKIINAGFQPQLTDRKGSRLSSGGDYELCYVMQLAGFEVWYAPELIFSHFIYKDRLSWQYYRRFITESVKCFEVLDAYSALLKYPNSHNSEMLLALSISRGVLYYLKEISISGFKLVWYVANDNQRKIHKLNINMNRKRIARCIFSYHRIRRNFHYARTLQLKLQRCNG